MLGDCTQRFEKRMNKYKICIEESGAKRLGEYEIGKEVCNIGGKYIRSRGTKGRVKSIEQARVWIEMPSGKEKAFERGLLASEPKIFDRSPLLITEGLQPSAINQSEPILSNARRRGLRSKAGERRQTAGDRRRKNRRPVVRGVAMNPVDHPHGGGEGRSKGGRPSCSPWGKICK